MSEENDEALFQKDRRKNLRDESTDRRQELRPTKRLIRLKIIVGAIFFLVGCVIIFLINPNI